MLELCYGFVNTFVILSSDFSEFMFLETEMDDRILNILFRGLAVGCVPALLWVNSLSVDLALMRSKVDTLNARVVNVEGEQKKIMDGVRENQSSLREMKVTINFIKLVLTEIRDEIKK